MKPQVQQLIQRFIQPYREPFKVWVQKLHDVVGTNMELAQEHFAQGQYADAAFRYRFVAWWAPDNFEAWLGLALSEAAMQKWKKARAAVNKAGRLNSKDPRLTEAIQVIREAERNAAAPPPPPPPK
ncbi:MAG: tetratricopeptide repeat protein [Alphaproteobacteria bacterium]|nr:tetratricopeptide repeat protein [Alphaproteobacteria bacterium]